MTTPPTHVPVAGLLVPATLVPRIIRSLRGTYPSLTEGLSDDAAVRSVLKHWIATTLATYEGQMAEAPVGDAIQSTVEEFREAARAARERALVDAAKITENPNVTPPVLPG